MVITFVLVVLFVFPPALFRSADIDIPIQGSEIKVRSAAVDGAIDALIDLNAIRPSLFSVIVDRGFTVRWPELNIEIAVHVTVVRAHFEVSFGICRES